MYNLYNYIIPLHIRFAQAHSPRGHQGMLNSSSFKSIWYEMFNIFTASYDVCEWKVSTLSWHTFIHQFLHSATLVEIFENQPEELAWWW